MENYIVSRTDEFQLNLVDTQAELISLNQGFSIFQIFQHCHVESSKRKTFRCNLCELSVMLLEYLQHDVLMKKIAYSCYYTYKMNYS